MAPEESGNMCPPFRTQGILWNWTLPGHVAMSPCPKGASGTAKFTCTEDGYWELSPDMLECKSKQMTDLEDQVRSDDPENVIASKLAHLTQTPGIFSYGGDIESSVDIMKTVIDRLQYMMQTHAESFYNKEFYIQEIMQNMLRSASNLMKDDKISTWIQMPAKHRSKILTHMLQALEENAFLLADVTQSPEILEETSSNTSKFKEGLFLGEKCDANL